MLFFFFFKQKTAYEMRISDWSSDVCSSDLNGQPETRCQDTLPQEHAGWCGRQHAKTPDQRPDLRGPGGLPEGRRPGRGPRRDPGAEEAGRERRCKRRRKGGPACKLTGALPAGSRPCAGSRFSARAEERRVGKEWVSTS